MSALPAALDAFHFLRPLWLVLVPLVLLLWWGIRRRATVRTPPPEGIAPHLAAALSVGGDSRRRLLPIDGVALAALLAILGAAGPTWSRVPSPLVSQTAPLAIAIEVSASMTDTDIGPSRLQRGQQKVLDLLDDRAGARTALVAYAGTAHRVTPLTEDPEVLKPFLDALSPDIMPADGQDATAALARTEAALAEEELPGAILFVLDDMDRADFPAFETHAAAGGAPVVVLSILPESADLPDIPAASVVRVTVDDADVTEIGRRVASAYAAALAGDDRQDWDDRGWLLAWPAALLVLLWFRQGWTMRWGAVLLAFALPATEVRAAPIDWFFTPDQQGRLAYDDLRFEEAADRFTDPMWRGHALYRDGQYEAAAEVFERLDTSDAAFAAGMAHIRSRGYRPAIAAFETALARDPDNEAAARNLEIAKAILAYVEEAREQSDTGEETGIGADDIVFDNEANRGTETEIDASPDHVEFQTTEQWMRAVDTSAGDFLKLRFNLEASEATR